MSVLCLHYACIRLQIMFRDVRIMLYFMCPLHALCWHPVCNAFALCLYNVVIMFVLRLYHVCILFVL